MSLSDLNIKITDTGISIPDAGVILSEVESQWNAAFNNSLNLDPSTPQGQLIATMAQIIFQQKTELLNLMNQFNPLNATGSYQDAIGKIYFLTRLPAQPTVVSCTCTGLAGTVIPGMDSENPASVHDLNGNILKCQTSTTIGINGTATVFFECAEKGPILIPANTVTIIDTIIAGWDTITNPQAGVTGRDIESRIDFEKRRYNSVAINSVGTTASIFGAVSSLTGVTSVKILNNNTGISVTKQGVSLIPHSIFVCVNGGNNLEIANAIYKKCSAGCDYNGTTVVTVQDPVTFSEAQIKFQRPTDTLMAFRIRVSQLDAGIEQKIKNTIISEFNGTFKHKDGSFSARYGIGDEVYASKFYTSLYEAEITKILTIGIKISSADDNDPTAYGDVVTCNADTLPTVDASKIYIILVS